MGDLWSWQKMPNLKGFSLETNTPRYVLPNRGKFPVCPIKSIDHKLPLTYPRRVVGYHPFLQPLFFCPNYFFLEEGVRDELLFRNCVDILLRSFHSKRRKNKKYWSQITINVPSSSFKKKEESKELCGHPFALISFKKKEESKSTSCQCHSLLCTVKQNGIYIMLKDNASNLYLDKIFLHLSQKFRSKCAFGTT